VIPTLASWPEFKPDLSISCKAGDTCPETGIWICQQMLDEGIEDFSIAFALKGRPMQPAYRIRREEAFMWRDSQGNGKHPYIDQVTTAEEATWYPLREVQPSADTRVVQGAGGRQAAMSTR
jgi:hypothetical protein